MSPGLHTDSHRTVGEGVHRKVEGAELHKDSEAAETVHTQAAEADATAAGEQPKDQLQVVHQVESRGRRTDWQNLLLKAAGQTDSPGPLEGPEQEEQLPEEGLKEGHQKDCQYHTQAAQVLGAEHRKMQAAVAHNWEADHNSGAVRILAKAPRIEAAVLHTEAAAPHIAAAVLRIAAAVLHTEVGAPRIAEVVLRIAAPGRSSEAAEELHT